MPWPFGQGDTPNLFPYGFSHSPDGPKAPPHGRFHGGFLSYWRSLQSPVRGKNFPDITQVMVCNITIISGWLLFPKKLRVNEKVKNQYTAVG